MDGVTLYNRSGSGKLSLSNMAIYLLVFICMFIPRRLSIGIDVYKIFLLIALGFVLKSSSGKLAMKMKEFNVFMLLFFGMAFFRYFIDFNMITGMGLFLDTLVMMFLSATLFCNKNNFAKFVRVFAIGLIFYSILCIIESFTNFNVFDIISGKSLGGFAANSMRYGINRSYGSFTTSINNGLFLSLASGLVFYFAINSQKGKKIYGWSCALSAIACILTLSRGPLLGLVIFYVACLMKAGFYRVIQRHTLHTIVIIFLICCLFIIPQTRNAILAFYNMFAAIFDSDAASNIASSFGTNANGVGNRLELVSWVWESIEGNEAFGVGTMTKFAYNFLANTNQYLVKTSIENHFLYVLYQFGVVGLILFCLFWFNEIILFVRRIKKKKLQGLKDFDFFMLITVIEYLIVITTVASSDDIRFVYLLLGMSAAYMQLYNKGTWDTVLKRI